MERRESRVESQNCFRSPPAGTRLSTLRSQLVSDPCGIRTQPNQRERLTTSPEVERAGVAGLWPLKHGLNKWKLFAACSASQARHKNSFQLPTRTNSGPGGARTLVPESSARCYTVSATGPTITTVPETVISISWRTLPASVPSVDADVGSVSHDGENLGSPRNETARCPLRDTGLLNAAGGQTADVTCAGDTDSVRRSIRYTLAHCRTHN